MRIIAGRFKRRKLLANPGLVTRPITDRVKVSLFQYLESDLQDARVADIFAGTGTLGLEALSRGARTVVFFERDRDAFELLKTNVATVGMREETLCWNVDVTRTSFRPKNCDLMLPYDVIFFDPPYKMVPDIRPGTPLYRSLERLSREGIASSDALLLFRTPKFSEFELPPIWQIEHVSEYSSMTVHWFRRTEARDNAASVASVDAIEPAESVTPDTPDEDFEPESQES